jgi:hypothetical protein
VDQEADAGHDQQHHRGELVDEQVEGDVNPPTSIQVGIGRT